MVAKLIIFSIRSLISLLLGVAHVYFVILCFGFIATINPVQLWIMDSDTLRGSALLWLSIMDLVLHLLLAVPVVIALLYLQTQLRRYHLCLVAAPMLGFGLYSLWQLFSQRHELSLTYLSYINTLLPAFALLLVGFLALKHFGHIKPAAASLRL